MASSEKRAKWLMQGECHFDVMRVDMILSLTIATVVLGTTVYLA